MECKASEEEMQKETERKQQQEEATKAALAEQSLSIIHIFRAEPCC